MTSIKEWATIVCFATICCSLFEFLLPCGSMEKIMRFTLGAFVICAMLCPFSSFIKGFNFDIDTKAKDTNGIYEFSDETERQSKEIAAKSIEGLIVNELKEINVYPQKVDIFMDTNADNSISISKVKINLTKQNADRKEEVKKLIDEKFGLKALVVF